MKSIPFLFSAIIGFWIATAAIAGGQGQAPNITIQPTNRVTSIGGAATFSVTATGDAPLAYRWQKDGHALLAGTNRLLSLINLGSGSAGTYTVVVTNLFGTVTSQPASLMLTGAPPRVSLQPTDDIVCPGGPNTSLRVQASGSPPLYYQWLRDGQAGPSQTNAVLHVPGDPASIGNYAVVITNAYGSDTSRVTQLTVGPIVTENPQSQTLLLHSVAELRASALACGNTSLQWRKDGLNIPDATNSSLNFPSLSLEDEGDYLIVVTEGSSSVTSTVARLSVQPFPLQITEQPISKLETYEPEIQFRVGFSGAPSPTFQWLKNGAILPGETNRLIRFPALPENQGHYRVVLSNAIGSVQSQFALFTLPPVAPVLTEHPVDRAFCPEHMSSGDATVLHVTAQGVGITALYYQWFKNGDPIIDATGTILDFSAITSPFGEYTVRVSNYAGSVTSNPVNIAYGSVILMAPATSQMVFEGSSAYFEALTDSCGPVTFQWQKDGINLPDQTNHTLIIERATRHDSGIYTAVVLNQYATNRQSAELIIEHNDPYFVDPPPSNAAVFAGENVYLDVSFESGYPAASVQWYLSGHPIPGATNGHYEFLAVSPQQQGRYYAVLSNANVSVVSQYARVQIFFSPPIFDLEPEDHPLSLSNSTAYFLCFALGSPPPTYQWLHSGRPISGATNIGLWIEFLSTNQMGGYSVIASNFLGSVTSRVATLTALLEMPVFLSEPEDQTVEVGQTLTLQGLANGLPQPTYQWFFNGAPIPGARDRTLNLWAGFSNQIGGYSLVASNAVGMATSRVAQVDIALRSIEFATHPTQQQLVVGEILGMSISLSNRLPALIQWQRNGEDLPGATNYAFTVRTSSTNDSGDYRVIAANDLGSVTSRVASVDVRLPGALDRWTWRRSLPQANHLHAAAYGNGRHVAIGEAGAVLVSTNGTDWVDQHKPGFRFRLQHLCFGNGRFVAHDSDLGRFVSSTNGVDWTDGGTQNPEISSGLQRISHGNGRFVAGDYEGKTYVSTNGLDWEARTLDEVFFEAGATEPHSWVLHEAVFAHDRFIASFRIYSPRELSGVLTSTNGLDWQSYILPNPELEILPAVASAAFGNNRYIALLTYDPYRILISTNGREWAIETLPIPPEYSYFSTIAFGTGRFVRSQYGNPLASSVDGLNWTDHPGVYSNTLAQVYFHDDRFVAVGDYGALVTSSNGIDWQIHNAGSPLNFRGITRADGTFVVVGNDGLILSSADDRHWIRSDSGTNFNFRAVTRFKGHYIAVGEQINSFPSERRTIYTSTDAVHWQPVIDPSPAARGDFYSLAHSPEIIVAVGNTGTVSWSEDGLTWESASPLSRIRDLNAVIWAAGAFHTAGKDGTVMTSTNGSHWRSIGPGGGRNLHGIAHGNDVFVTVGNRGRYYVGAGDGSWQQHDWPTFEDLSEISFAGGRFVAVGDYGVLFTSPDGTNWTRQVTPSGNDLRSVVYTDGSYWVVGNNESILQSDQIDPALRIHRVPGTTDVTLDLLGETGVIHRLQGSHNFTDWVDILNFTASPEPRQHRTADPNVGGWRFYRLAR